MAKLQASLTAMLGAQPGGATEADMQELLAGTDLE
jgi:hypothetical protein